MPVDSSGKYRGKHFDPNFKHPRQPGFSYTGYHPLQSSRYDDLNPAREPLRDRGQQYVQNGSERDHHAAYRGRPTSNNYSTPRGPRESYPQARGPSMPQVSPIGTIHPSGLPLIPDLPPPEKANGSNGDSPSMNSRPSSASQPLHPKPPSSGSLPFGTSLESLDKLRQFKAEVEASRRQHQATELEPGKLAQMAESFLRSQQHEPGEVSEDTSQVKPTLSPRTREQELKEKLRSRLKSPDGEGSGGVKRERESGEIVETIEQKRPRAEEPHQHPAQNHSPYDQKRADEEVLSRGYTDQRYFRDQAPQANPPRHAELASQLRERVEAVHILLPEQPRNDQPRQREENTYSQLSNPHHKEDYQIESSKRPFAEHGNGGRFTKREDTPSSVARKESSTYERRSLSERISTTPSYTRPTRSPSRSAPKKTYRGPTRLISPPEARAVARYERAPSPPQYHDTRQSGPSYSSSTYAAPRAPDLAKPVRAYERSPARHAPAAESRSVIADAYANRSSTVSERAPSGYAGEPRTARDKPTFADPFAKPPPADDYSRPVTDYRYAHPQPVAIDTSDVAETLAALKAQISKLEALVPRAMPASPQAPVREFRELYPPARATARSPPRQSPRVEYMRPQERAYEPPPRSARPPPTSPAGGGRGGYKYGAYEERSYDHTKQHVGYDNRASGYDNRQNGYEGGGGRGGRGGRGIRGGRGARGRGGGGYGKYD